MTVELQAPDQATEGLSASEGVEKYTIETFKPLVYFYRHKETTGEREIVKSLSYSEEEAININTPSFSLLDGLGLFKNKKEEDFARDINLSLNVFAFCRHFNKKQNEGMALSYTERFQTDSRSSYSFANILSQNLRAILKNAKSAGQTLQCNFIITGVAPGGTNRSVFNLQVDNLFIDIDLSGIQEHKQGLRIRVENEIVPSDPNAPVILSATSGNLARTFILDNNEQPVSGEMKEATKTLQLMCLNPTFQTTRAYTYFSDKVTYPLLKNKISMDEIIYHNQNNRFDLFLESVRGGNEKEWIKSVYCYLIQYRAHTIGFFIKTVFIVFDRAPCVHYLSVFIG